VLYDDGGAELLEDALKKGRGGANKLPKGNTMKVEMEIGLSKLYLGGEVKDDVTHRCSSLISFIFDFFLIWFPIWGESSPFRMPGILY
jgi:hypothetical protein